MKPLFLFAITAIMIVACSNDSELDDKTGPVAMNIGVLSSDVSNVATRSNYTLTGNTELQSNVGLYIYKHGTLTTTNSYGYSNVLGTKGTTANVTYGTEGDKADCTSVTASIYYPDVKTQAVDIYAYAPHSSDAPTDLTSTPTVAITTSADQSSGYASDDYLFGKIVSETLLTADNCKAAKGGTATEGYTDGGTVVVPMDHKMSKVIVNLMVEGMSLDKIKNATVKIYPDYSQATMSLLDGTITNSTTAGVNTTTGNEITLTTTLGTTDGTAVITAGKDGHPNTLGTDNDKEGYSACGIILPQTLSASHKFIGITLYETTSEYAYTPIALTLESGKVYTFNITVTATGISVATLVNNWAEGEWGTSTSPVTDTAVLQ